MDIKLIAIDIDGTLVNDMKQITQTTIQAVNKARKQGIKVVLCSGRPLSGVKPYLEKLGISGNNEYAITFNGGTVQTLDGKILFSHGLSYDDFLQVEMLSRKFNVHFQVENNDGIYVTNRNQSPYSTAEGFLVHLPINYRAPEDITPDTPIAKAMYVDFPKEIQRVKPLIPKDLKERLNIVQSETCFLEIMDKQASKGNALKDLGKSLGLTVDNIMALGDAGNDLSMIQYAKTSVAMGNATKEVKEAASFVTKTNNENGAAYAIDKFVNNK